MIFLLLWSLRATVVLALGGLLALALRRRSAATQSLVLRVTLVSAWLLPLAALVAPPFRIAAHREGPVVALTRALPLGKSVATPKLVPAAILPATPAVFDTTRALTAAYACGSLILILRWTAGLARLRRLVRQSSRVERGVRLLPSGTLNTPATFGLLAPTILLPAASVGWPESRVRAAVLHERAHVRRCDWAWQTVAGLLAALHWANPAVWLLSRALRETAEMAADDEVLATGIPPSGYARELLAFAATARPVAPAVAMARRGGVSARVAAILSNVRDRRPPGRATLALSSLALAPLTLAVAGFGIGQKNAPSGVGGLRLVAIRERTATGVQTWAPDGSPNPALPEGLGDFPSLPSLGYGGRLVEFVFFAPDERSTRVDFRLNDRYPKGIHAQEENYGGIVVYDVGGTVLPMVLPWSSERGGTVYAMVESVPQGWRGPIDLDASWTEGENAPVVLPKGAYHVGRVAVDTFGQAAKPYTSIAIEFPKPAGLDERDLRFFALDVKGREIASQSGYVGLVISGVTTLEETLTTPLPPGAVARLDYAAKRRVHRVFHDVPLDPAKDSNNAEERR